MTMIKDFECSTRLKNGLIYMLMEEKSRFIDFNLDLYYVWASLGENAPLGKLEALEFPVERFRDAPTTLMMKTPGFGIKSLKELRERLREMPKPVPTEQLKLPRMGDEDVIERALLGNLFIILQEVAAMGPPSRFDAYREIRSIVNKHKEKAHA